MSNRRFHPALLALLTTTLLLPLRSADAEVTCIQAINKVVKGKVRTQLKKVTRSSKCKTGEVLVPAGPKGADGSLRIYGDGSAGAKTFGTETLIDTSAMYTDVTVTGTLTVPSGTVIRCTGSFVNNGTIKVEFGAFGGGLTNPTHPGISLRAAGSGRVGVNTDSLPAGVGGVGLPESSAALLRYPGSAAGGSSGGGTGRRGGGALTILCKGGITNVGSITADGEGPVVGNPLADVPASGGGGGGVVILASSSSVTLSSGSSISAKGGDGRRETAFLGATEAPGGGGGGGIVHLLAPSITTTGATINVAGGTGGQASSLGGLLPGPERAAGSGGGASGGNGGDGSSITANNNSVSAGENGLEGHIITSELDPTPLF